MYQVIEYNDYRKENYIILHGITSDLEKAKQRARKILEEDASGYKCYEESSSFYQIYQLDTEDHPNQYIQLQPGRENKKSVMCEYTFRYIEFSGLLNKTVGELYTDILDEKVPKSVSPDETITKELFVILSKTRI